MILNQVKDIINKETTNSILAIIPYGSQVYGNKESNDYDFIVIVDNDFEEKTIHNRDDIDISIIDKDKFKKELKNHSVRSFELLFCPQEHPLMEISGSFQSEFFLLQKNKVEPSKIRHEFSQKTSNSYVKAKKKIIIDNDFDYMTSLKSLWHSIRILDFGVQLVKNGNLQFDSMNELYQEINNDYALFISNDKEKMWQQLHSKYKPVFNQKHSELKSLCPKEEKSKKLKR